jgi:ABC-type multidrug transport system permease subunit
MRTGDESEQALDVGNASTAELFNRAFEQATLIIRQELALARAEVVQKLKRAVLGTMLSVGAAAIAFVALLCGVAAAVAGLAGVVPTWAAALIVAAVLLVGAAVVGALALRAFAKASPSTPPDVVASVRDDLSEIKEHLQQHR